MKECIDPYRNIDINTSEWKKIRSRKFSEEECASCACASVVASRHGRSVCFMFTTRNVLIPLDSAANVHIGDVLKVKDLTLVALHYIGANLDNKVTDILMVRVGLDEMPTITFENPFGL